jgi:integrase
MVKQGLNPHDDKVYGVTARTTPRFVDFASEICSAKTAGDGMVEGSKERWWRNVNVYFKPLHDKQLHEITVDDIAGLLKSRWATQECIANDMRSRLETIFDAAASRGHRSMSERNIASRALVEPLLPTRSKKKSKRNHASMPYEQVPAFMVELRKVQTIGAKALQMTILTCVRAGEALQMRWDQIKTKEDGSRCWKIPGKTMKNGLEADVPLSSAACALLDEMKALELSDVYVFPTPRKKDTPMTPFGMLQVLQLNMGYDGKDKDKLTVHGFRSSFRSHGQDETEHARETLEFCLHHIVGDDAEVAYTKGGMWKKRKAALEDWARYCGSHQPPAKKKFVPQVVAA